MQSRRSASIPAVAIAFLASGGHAQEHLSPADPGTHVSPPSLADVLVPIHTQPADPAGGAYGWWAAAESFKCSFHDGFTFYPWVGPDVPANLPFAWRNTRVQAGGQDILRPASAVHAHTDLRWEYRYGDVTEAYDVRREGVEQTFTIARRPAGSGDLVVRGEIVTPLLALPAAAAHQEIVFRDEDGNARVVYGAAVAIDARGRRTPVATSFDGATIALTVDARTVATAAYPLMIDPLTSAVLYTYSSQSHSEIALQSDGSEVVTYFTRRFSATDLDGYAVVTAADFSFATRVLIFTDITTFWSTRYGDVAAGRAQAFQPRRWLVCVQRDMLLPQNRSVLSTYVHDAASTTANSGITLSQPSSTAVTQRYPHISCQNSGYLLLVFQQDTTSTQQNTLNSEVLGQRISMGSLSMPPFLSGSAFTLDTLPVAPNQDREFPAVSRTNTTSYGVWAVVWQERDHQAGGWWRIRCAFVRSDGFTTGSVGGANHLGDFTAPIHHIRPRVDGQSEIFLSNTYRFVATFLTGAPNDISPAGTAVETHRFDFTYAWPLIRTSIARRVVATSPTPVFTWPSIAHDPGTGSHWGIVYQRGTSPTWQIFAARVGATGGVVEAATVYANPTTGAYHPAICRAADTSGGFFPIAYATNESPTSLNPIYGRQFRYPTTPANTVYGNGCGGTISASRLPNAGDGSYELLISNAAPGQPAALLVSAGSTSVPLASIGLGTCYLNVDAAAAVFFPTTISAAGAGRVPMPLMDSPVFIGDLYFQWFFLHPTTPWPGRAALTQGLRAAVR